MESGVAAERYFRRVGLPELVIVRGHRPVRWRFLALLVLFTAAVGTLDILLYTRPGPLFTVLDIIATSAFVLILVVVVDECSRHRPRRLWQRILLWIAEAFIGFLLVNEFVSAIQGEVPGVAIPVPSGTYAFAWAAVIAVVSAVGAIGGISLVRRVVVRAVLGIPRSLPVIGGTVPVMLGFAAALVLVPDVWRLMARIQGWRLETVVLGSIAVMSLTLYIKLRADLRSLEPDRDDSAFPLTWRMRLNVAVAVVLPLLIRFLAAALVLAVILFCIGMVVFDSTIIDEVAPGVAPAKAAGKVAALISMFAAVLVTIAHPRAAIRELAEGELHTAEEALRLWSSYSSGRPQTVASITSTA
ncbi:MAG TPA: hypothetical protein VJU79_00545 [Candidatus Dormibacteraeota bacterium]|nr:hypothetical protein [Candidatus Dormibacteraeota bacterium]